MRYLALGDSYTIGEGVAADARWPLLLARALQAEDIALDDPRIIATTGWTTDELATAIDAAEPLDEWDLVTLMVGVNNQYRGRDIGNYRDEFNALLLRAIAFTGGRAGRVLVLSIPDWGVTRFAADAGSDPGQIAGEIDAFNAVALATCVAHDVAFVDITPLSRQLGAEAAMLADDGLHPSAAMHALFAACALPVARRLLAKA